MGFSINGNDNVQRNPYLQQEQATNIGKQNATENVQVADNKAIGEFGNKLLEQVQPRFVETARIEQADAEDLKEMAAMAGIKNMKMPTVAQYASIAGHVGEISENFDRLTTTNNVQALFDSPEFDILNKEFNIIT